MNSLDIMVLVVLSFFAIYGAVRGIVRLILGTGAMMTGLFLAGKVSFPAITQTVTSVVRDHAATPIQQLEHVLAADRSARDSTLSLAGNP